MVFTCYVALNVNGTLFADRLSNVVQSLIALAILFTYPLQFYVPVDLTWPYLKEKFATTSPVTKELFYRALLVLLTCELLCFPVFSGFIVL